MRRVRVHLCNRRQWTCTGAAPALISRALLLAVAGGILGMVLAVLTPVPAMALTPTALGGRLVGLVVRISLTLLPLPTPASCPLALRL